MVENRYYEMFPMRAAMDPSLPWDGKDTELWTELVAQDKPMGGSCVGCGTRKVICTPQVIRQ